MTKRTRKDELKEDLRMLSIEVARMMLIDETNYRPFQFKQEYQQACFDLDEAVDELAEDRPYLKVFYYSAAHMAEAMAEDMQDMLQPLRDVGSKLSIDEEILAIDEALESIAKKAAKSQTRFDF